MLESPHVTRSEPQLIASIHLTIPPSEIQNVMGPGIQEVMEAVAAQGITPTGPWFTHFFRLDDEIMDFEIAVPVAAPVAPAGRVRPGQLPAATVARAVYRGPYEGLVEAWGEFDAWIAAQGHKVGPELWEVYAVGPETSANPADWRTELNRPLIG